MRAPCARCSATRVAIEGNCPTRPEKSRRSSIALRQIGHGVRRCRRRIGPKHMPNLSSSNPATRLQGPWHFRGNWRTARIADELALRWIPFVSIRVISTITRRFSQCAANTNADKTKPRITLTTAPALKARNGLVPALASSRNRVVRPMLRKQKMKAQVRRSLTGADQRRHHGLVVVGKAVAARSRRSRSARRPGSR